MTNSVLNGSFNGPAGAFNRHSNAFTWRSREDLNIDTRTATEYGVARTFFDATFTWMTGNANASTTSLAVTNPATGFLQPAINIPNGFVYTGDGIAGGFLGVYYALIQFAGFTMGKAISRFSAPWTNYPANNFDGLPGGGGTVTGVNQFSYTADLGQGYAFSVSAQDPTQYYQTNIFNTTFPATGCPPRASIQQLVLSSVAVPMV